MHRASRSSLHVASLLLANAFLIDGLLQTTTGSGTYTIRLPCKDTMDLLKERLEEDFGGGRAEEAAEAIKRRVERATSEKPVAKQGGEALENLPPVLSEPQEFFKVCKKYYPVSGGR